MKAIKIFKIVSLCIAVLGLIIELLILIWSIQEALHNQSLTGSARAQSEMFMIPMMIFGGPCAIVGFILIVVNAIIDIRKKSKIKLNFLIYIVLVLIVFIPPVSLLTLIPLMYSGWK